MTNLLCKLFIKNRDRTQDPAVRRQYGTLASVVGIIVNLLLCAGKMAAGIITGAVSITADAVNNLSDAASQIVSLISFKLSAKPADRDHPFGHARIEYVASMAVSFLVLLVGFELLKSSVTKIFRPEPTRFDWVSIIILAVSVVAKVWLYLFNRKIAKRIDSSVMRATAADSLSDAGATLAVLVCAIILRFTGLDIDAYVGIAVSVVIIIAGIKILGEAKNLIIGEAPDADIVQAIRSIVEQYPEALGIHDLVVHNYGAGTVIASLHIEVDGEINVFRTHDIVDNIEKRLCSELGIRCTIHMDPIVTNNAEITETREKISAAMKELDSAWSIHDFRFVPGETHTNLIFDLVIPFECKLSEDAVKALVENKVKTIDETYFTVITIDRE